MLNPDLDTEALARRYAEDDRVRIDALLVPDVAERMRDICLRDVNWEYLANTGSGNAAIPADEFRRLGAERIREFQNQLMEAAAKGVGFLYCGYHMDRADVATNSDNLKFLHSVFDYLNGREMLEFITAVTGRDDLKSADAQFTRYTQGHYLTRHSDDVTIQGRRAAYVLSLTKNWHPDWGGLLQFFEKDGTPRDAWSPRFNSMSLFDVRHVHSVTFVAPFALEPRLSLTGWFRSQPRSSPRAAG